MAWLAYLFVLPPLPTFVNSIATLFVGVPLSAILRKIKIKNWALISPVIDGIWGEFLAVGYCYILFYYFYGSGSYGWLQFLASCPGLIIPIWNVSHRGAHVEREFMARKKELEQAESDFRTYISEKWTELIDIYASLGIGRAIGLIAGAGFFVVYL